MTSRPTDSYQIQIKDALGNMMSEMSRGGVDSTRLTMTVPADIKAETVRFGAVDQRQLAKTAFEVEFTSTMPYPKGAYFVLGIRPIEVGPAEPKDDVKCFSNLQVEAACAWLNDTSIKVDELVKADIGRNTHITLMLTNFEIKVTKPLVTKSWSITVFTHDGYFIETRTSGLSIEFKCEVPCQTCVQNQPTICTSCNTLTGLNLIF